MHIYVIKIQTLRQNGDTPFYCGCLWWVRTKKKREGWASAVSGMFYLVKECYGKISRLVIPGLWVWKGFLKFPVLVFVGRSDLAVIWPPVRCRISHAKPAPSSDSGHITCDQLLTVDLLVDFPSPVPPACHDIIIHSELLIRNVIMPSRHTFATRLHFPTASEARPDLHLQPLHHLRLALCPSCTATPPAINWNFPYHEPLLALSF